MSRKTIEVEAVLDYANTLLSHSLNADERRGVMLITEEILHRTGNYRGFKYLDKFEVPEGELPGINVDNNRQMYDGDERFDNTDRTRVQYYYS